jgi:uncharacterized Fe-S cluster protein YjdI
MYILKRNMTVCNDCGECLEIFPLLLNGEICISDWALEDSINSNRIYGIIDQCSADALLLEEK